MEKRFSASLERGPMAAQRKGGDPKSGKAVYLAGSGSKGGRRGVRPGF